ncbi:MAG: MBL fold metallo-hydrolase [Oscillospiraceae bacterium]
MGKITVTQLGEGTWQLHEDGVDSPVDAYLVIGEKRGVVIDSLQETEELYQRVRELTDLPLDLVLTHAHLDHVGRATDGFKNSACGVLMKHEDKDLLGIMGCFSFPEGYFQDIEEGKVFSLGGRTLEIIPMPGHTAGSIALLDRKNELLFSGDSIGSGPFWLQLPHSLSMETFVQSATNLLNEVEGMEDLLVLPGHRVQSRTTLGIAYVRDILETAQLILDGTLDGEAGSLVFEGEPMNFKMAEHKSMQGFYYAPNNLLNSEEK